MSGRTNKWLLVLLVMVLCLFFSSGCASPGEKTSAVTITRADEWAEDHPDQYATYLKNEEMVRTTFGGSEPIDYLEKYPELLTLYDGMGFSIEYLRARGHVYALEDVIHTARSKPGASCMACKTADYVALEAEHGESLYAMDFDEMVAQAHSGVSCYDCHRNEPGVLQITRGHLEKGLSYLEEEHDMKNLVCAQCHIEYYLAPDTKEVTVPWKYGTGVAGIEETFIEWNHVDWVHPQTDGDLYKIQHPEFETYLGSVHNQFNVTCVDCHMPELTNEAGGTFHSHHWTSPLKYVEGSCLGCHSEAGPELIARVEGLQGNAEEKTVAVSRKLVELIGAIASQKDSLDESTLNQVHELHRSAQLRWDFVFVENSQGFHNHAKTMEYLQEADDMADEALRLLQ